MTNDPTKDYRYTLGDIEIEGYQITPASRYRDQEWPPWLKPQRLPDDMNSVFSHSDNPNRLWLNLPTGEVELPQLAWIVKYKDGHLGIIEALEFEEAKKVVPIPPKVITPPADGMPDESHLAGIYPQHVKEGKTAADYRRPAAGEAAAVPIRPVMSAENLGGDVTEMRNEMMSAIKLLQEVGDDGGDDLLQPKAVEALDYLIHAMTKRTRWCTCSPGICLQADEAGCRINSPLVKNG